MVSLVVTIAAVMLRLYLPAAMAAGMVPMALGLGESGGQTAPLGRAVLGGLLIGFIQDYNEGLSWHAPGSAWTNSIVFGILINLSKSAIFTHRQETAEIVSSETPLLNSD